jgi:hypothetical protein
LCDSEHLGTTGLNLVIQEGFALHVAAKTPDDRWDSLLSCCVARHEIFAKLVIASFDDHPNHINTRLKRMISKDCKHISTTCTLSLWSLSLIRMERRVAEKTYPSWKDLARQFTMPVKQKIA